MNVEELSMIGPDVNLQKVDAINKKRLLAFFNHFIINTSEFLNNLSKICENRLMNLENKIQKLETSIILLESKLNSVPGLDVNEATEPVMVKPPSLPESQPVEEHLTEGKVKEPEEIEIQPEKLTIDPAHMKYVKMLQFGVVLPAVKFKMEQEGVDPSLYNAILNYHK